ncbi:MAG: T9SS type A sorting domain-containing protein, partial [Flavobacteriales bacterium]|nr:T9SS type A sorting domain-containing protein [Flavobacteriales bacterium]
LKIFSREKNYVVDAEELEDDKFRLFPNPSGTQIQIDFQSSAVRELMVFDVQGRLIEQKVITSASHNLTVATYSVGLYVLKVITNSESRTARIVVQR